MKIIFPLSNSPHIGGGSYVGITYSRGLVSRGHEIYIFPSFNIDYIQQEVLEDNLVINKGFKRKKIFSNHIVSQILRKFIIDKIMFYRISHFIKKNISEIDYIMSIPLLDGMRSIKLGKKYKIPVIAIAYETEPFYYERMSKINRKIPLVKKIANKVIKWYNYKKAIIQSDVVIAISPITKVYIEKWVNKPVDAVIHPGIDENLSESFFTPDSSNNENYVVFVGRLFPNKNVSDIILALSKLDNPPLLKIIGQGPLSNSLESLAIELSVVVEFMGSVSDEKKWQTISKSLVLIAPSSFEGSFDVPAEAGIFRKPTIAYDIPGLSLEWEDAVIKVPEKNIESLAHEINKVSIDKNYREMMGKRAEEYTLANYTITKCGEKLEQILLKKKFTE